MAKSLAELEAAVRDAGWAMEDALQGVTVAQSRAIKDAHDTAIQAERALTWAKARSVVGGASDGGPFGDVRTQYRSALTALRDAMEQDK